MYPADRVALKADGKRQDVPRIVRLGLSLLGLFSLIAGLALGAYVLLGLGMSHGHGGDPIPDLRTLLVVLLPILLIAMGVIGLICTTMRRVVAMCMILVLILANVTVLAEL